MTAIHRSVRLLGIWVAVALVASTRLPGPDETQTFLSIASAAAVLALATTVWLWQKAPAGFHGWLFGSALAAILLPPSPDALLSGLPDWVPALAFVLALHGFFEDPAAKAPRLGAKGRAPQRILQFLPAALAVGVILALPLAMAFLPLRIRATYELHTALAPLIPLVFLGGLLMLAGALRTLLGRRTLDAPDSPAVDLPEPAEVRTA